VSLARSGIKNGEHDVSFARIHINVVAYLFKKRVQLRERQPPRVDCCAAALSIPQQRGERAAHALALVLTSARHV